MQRLHTEAELVEMRLETEVEGFAVDEEMRSLIVVAVDLVALFAVFEVGPMDEPGDRNMEGFGWVLPA